MPKGRPLLCAYCYQCNSKTNRFIKEQEAKTLLTSSGLKPPFSKVQVLCDVRFWLC